MLAQDLRAAGLDVIQWPLLEISPLEPPDLSALILQTQPTDLKIHYIFVSRSAIQHCPEALLSSVCARKNRVYAVGRATAERLESMGVSEVSVPPQAVGAEALLELAELQSVSGCFFVIMRGERGRDVLSKTLRARGARVWECLCYRQVWPQEMPFAVTNTSFDAILLTSALALQGLYSLCQSNPEGCNIWKQMESSLWLIPPSSHSALQTFLKDHGCTRIQKLSHQSFQGLALSAHEILQYL